MTVVEDADALASRVLILFRSRFGGDWRRAFRHYDADHDGMIRRGEVLMLLRDAGVGTYFTRGAWADGVIAEMDADGDGRIAWTDFARVFAARHPAWGSNRVAGQQVMAIGPS